MAVKLWNLGTSDIGIGNGNGTFVDSNGDIHVAGFDGGGSNSKLYYAISTDGGSIFTDGEGGGAGSYKQIITGVVNPSSASIVVDSNFIPYIFYTQGNNIYFVAKNASGATWGSASYIGDKGESLIHAEIDNDDNLIVVAGGVDSMNRWITCFTSVDSGQNWIEEYDANNHLGSSLDLCLDYNQHLWTVHSSSIFGNHTTDVNKITKTEGAPDSWSFGGDENTLSSGSNTIYSVAIIAERDSEIIWEFISINDSGIYKLQYNKKSSGTWGGWSIIISNGSNYYKNLQVVRSYGNNIYLIYEINGTTDLKFVQWNGSAWSEETTFLSNAIYCDIQQPNLANGITEIHFTYKKGDANEKYFHSLTPPPMPLTVTKQETITLSDEIDVNIPQETIKLSDTVSISDDIVKAYTSEEGDGLNINDELELAIHSNLTDTLDVSDNIITTLTYTHRSHINNIFGMVNGIVKDINNKFGILAESKSDIANKVGFLKSWQVSGDAGYQSLGKTYIKVYIDSVEQTDVDVDSITITKSLNSSHTASFILSRPYDNNKPSIELPIEIKYHIWTLYKGYITQIIPTDSPDSIRITCQDNYWKRNKIKKWFNIGHKPTDNQELFYNTISGGLSTCGASFGIGNFIPQTMNLFGTGESDCVSNLVTNCGNFRWYYDVEETKTLWTASQGDIIYLEKQDLGTNLGLHQILRHSFRESIERIVNKFRVQMGDFVWRRFNDTGGFKEYAGYRWSQYLGQIFSKWNDDFERLATNDYEPAYLDEDNNVIAQVGTSGVFRHPVEENDLYKDVFVKYDLPGLDSDFESWSDKISPHVIVRFPFFAGWKLSGSLKAPTIIWSPLGFRYELSEGFTIDYEKGEVIFNEPVYLYQSNNDGEITAIKKAKLEVAIYKERYYSNTEDPSDDPQTDISNPLMFFTEKCGDYPETIIENLTLSGLGIQIGGWEIVGRDDNNKPIYRYTPSWNDTAFAVDLANWRLTQNCDKKVSGFAKVTLDTICFYNINLSNRVMIEGVIENPLNITSISYNIGSWRVSLGLENGRYFKRSVSIQSHGE